MAALLKRKRDFGWLPTAIVLAVVLIAGSRLMYLSVQHHATAARAAVDVASGDIWVGAALLPRPIQSEPRLWQPVPATVSGVPSQRCWYSELPLMRLFPNCPVTRPITICRSWTRRVVVELSATQSQRDASPALALASRVPL